ncbi:HD domain-containing protein [Candidatus Saccharibacteria bacterium]|nr:HD domain-containing protein [Candidatus Saccharibacteria bacterium]
MTDLYSIMSFLEKFQAIERKTYYPLNNRGDTDAEHSFSLALAAWQIIIHDKLPLDADLVIKYALVHDLVEVYSGDVFALADKKARDEKVVKEKVALKKMKDDPNWREIAEIIEQYEAREDEESKFIYGLEKILVPVSALLNDCPCPYFFDAANPVTFEKWRDRVKDRILGSKYLQPYYDWLEGELKKHPKHFAKSKASDNNSNERRIK